MIMILRGINMINFTENDKEKIKNAYKTVLLNLKDYLQQHDVKCELEYSKVVFSMLHSGCFSMDGTIHIDNDFNYLGLSSDISEGIQVMHGICCCRHATEFLYNLLNILNLNPSLMYIQTNNRTGEWHKTTPTKANHLTILLNNQYIIDPINKFILEIQKGGELKLLDSDYLNVLKPYQEDNIIVIGKTLKKYYALRELDIKNVY